MNYKEVIKTCEVCESTLELNNKRDIERKRFCSASCRGKHSSTIRNCGNGVCVMCNMPFTKSQNNQTICGDQKCQTKAQIIRSYKMMDGNPEKYIAHLLLKKERRDTLPIEYVLELLESQKGKCALSGIKMTFDKKVGADKVHTNLSIDQIKAGEGYTIGNVQLVCAIVNIMKSTLSTDELRWWCDKICSAQER